MRTVFKQTYLTYRWDLNIMSQSETVNNANKEVFHTLPDLQNWSLAISWSSVFLPTPHLGLIAYPPASNRAL